MIVDYFDIIALKYDVTDHHFFFPLKLGFGTTKIILGGLGQINFKWIYQICLRYKLNHAAL